MKYLIYIIYTLLIIILTLSVVLTVNIIKTNYFVYSTFEDLDYLISDTHKIVNQINDYCLSE